jgi:hypothetical protein
LFIHSLYHRFYQIQPHQAARGQPTTQYDALSSEEDDEGEESNSDEVEESKNKEYDNNNKEEPRTQRSRLTRKLTALGITQEREEKSEEPRPIRSKMQIELRSLVTIPPAEESKSTTTSSNNEGSPGAIHSAITSDPGVPTTFEKAFFGPKSNVWTPAIYEELMSFINRKAFKDQDKKLVIEQLRRNLMTSSKRK